MTGGYEDDDVLRMLEALYEKLERLSVEQRLTGPRREQEVDELRSEFREAMRRVSELKRRPEDEARLAACFEAIDKNTARLLEAITQNTATTNNLLAELVSKNGAPRFSAPTSVLREGEYLKTQLAIGRMGTEGPGRPFDEPQPAISSGLEVLAATLTKPTASGRYR
jgi:hypothetical protein